MKISYHFVVLRLLIPIGAMMPALTMMDRATNLWRQVKEKLGGGPDSSAWLNTEAVVFSCPVGCEGRHWNAYVWYDYHLEKDHWSGSCAISFADEAPAQAYAAARPPGSNVQIRYCPNHPGRSVMFESDQRDPNPLAIVAQSSDF